jgi:hypothetical protein
VIRGLSYRWARGPPIDMKMGLSLWVYAHGAWMARSVYTLDEVRPFLSLIGNARFELLNQSVSHQPCREEGMVARDGV